MKKGREAEEEKERGVRICFWNIAGVTNKCEETCEYLEKFDIIGLTETSVEEETWEKIRNKLQNNYEWYCIPAILPKETKKKMGRRTKGGRIVAVSKEMKCETNVKKTSKNRQKLITLIYWSDEFIGDRLYSNE